ncbi:MAG: four helix bundle protein [Bacteroidota bacterium]
MEKLSNFEFGEQFKRRTKQFALRNIRLFQALPKTEEARVLGKQLLRSSTSVASNYRAACRARSDAEFLAKIGVVIEEADESLFWLELLEEANILPVEKLVALKIEASELVAITVKIRSSIKNKTNK